MAPLIFKNPERYSAKWQIKIFDGEPDYEAPHVSVIFKEHPLKTWRVNLRTLEVMDLNPPAKKLPSEFLDDIKKNIKEIREKWNRRYPKNLV